MGPESNVLAIHRLSPLTFNINCIRLTNNFHQNHVNYVFSTIAINIFFYIITTIIIYCYNLSDYFPVENKNIILNVSI